MRCCYQFANALTMLCLAMGASFCLVVSIPAAADALYRCQEANGAIRWQQRPCGTQATETIFPAGKSAPPTRQAQPEARLPAQDPAIQQALARLAERQEALDAQRRQLRAELEQELAALAPSARQKREGESEREQLASHRTYLELRKERERRYRAELRLIEKELEGIARERQALLRSRQAPIQTQESPHQRQRWLQVAPRSP